MTQSKRIAVTGGIGSGKSTLLSILKEFGYPVFSCDEIYRELRKEPSYLALLGEAFPDCMQGDRFDFAALSKKVFSDEAALKKLNALSHPLIMERLLRRMQGVSFAEVPLLYEGGFESLFDGVLVVVRDKAARISSVMARDSLSEAEILARIRNQIDESDLKDKDCVFIVNDGNIADLKKKTRDALCALNIE